MKRVFYPVGQGAYYSESHENIKKKEFNIVYDCGTFYYRTKKIRDTVKYSFKENSEIDILFVSHVDFDHISLIEVLVNNNVKIKKIIMPLLHDELKIMLANIFYAISDDLFIHNLLIDPNSVLINTEIIEVEPANDSSFEEKEKLDILESQLPSNIKSNTRLSLTTNDGEWVYVPYNYDNNTRQVGLENLLKKITLKNGDSLDIDKLKKDPKYVIDIIKTKEDRKAIKDTYSDSSIGSSSSKSVNINENSMFLYSGRLDDDRYKLKFLTKYSQIIHPYFWINHKPGCIYTGDGDLNRIGSLGRIYGNFINNVGTIQIPHHGAIKSFNKNALPNGEYFYILSYGTNNNFGHPSDGVISDLVASGMYIARVTEDKNSLFVQHFEK